MAAASSRLGSCVRPWFRIGRITRISVTIQHCCYTAGGSSDPSVSHLSSGLEKYKDLQRVFRRKLKVAYRRFPDILDHSVVSGHHYVYFIEDDGIYRVDKPQSEQEAELVLSLGQGSVQDKTGPDNGEREPSSLWTVQRVRLSPQEKHLAATLITNDTEETRCVVVRLRKRNSPVVFTLENVATFEWATDEVLFYTTQEALRCSRVFRLDLTSSGGRVTSVFEETHPDVFVEVALSGDQQILSINGTSRTTSEVRLINTTACHLEPVLVQARQPDLLYHVEHWRQRLIILASTGPGQEYQVVQAPLSEPFMASWVPLFTPNPGVVIKDMDVVQDHCVLVARMATGELTLIVVPLTNPKEVYTVQLPSWACDIKTKKPGMADQRGALELLISSPVRSPVPYCLYPEDGILLAATQDSSPAEYSYITTRMEACSQDGTLVPVTLLHTGPAEAVRHRPLLVHVYGAYGRDLNMEFSPEKRLLLEQGWTLAYCHVRGGGEQGLSWHRRARAGGKQRGVEDLRACLLHLHSSGVSSPSLTALTACSAGAVPVGALCNTHPRMSRAVTLQAPFLDLLGTMENPSLPLTLEDREEWGDPVTNPKDRLFISSYCPLHNITPQSYPSILLTAYSSDARVPLSGVLKYGERLKNAVHTYFTTEPKPENEPAPNIVLNVQAGASHLGPDDFELMLEEEALKLAFLYTELDLDPPPPRPRRKR